MSLLFVNTRPAERASKLTDELQTAGIEVVNLPLLSIETMPFEASDKQKIEQLLVSGYQALVVVSPSAARMGLAHCPDNYCPNFPVIAVGEATAQVLRQAGWNVSCPDSMNNEGMLKMQAISSLQAGQKVLIWRGQGGRRLLVDSLRARQVIVDSIAWYVRCCPLQLSQNYQFLCQHLYQNTDLYPIILISSSEAFGYWQQQVNQRFTKENMLGQHVHLPKSYELHDFYYLVLGERLSQELNQLGLPYTQLETLNPKHILQKLYQLKSYL